MGIGGAWIGNLTALEPYRPVFIVLVLVFLGLAFSKLYLVPRSCETDADCIADRTRGTQRLIFWIAAPLLLGLVAVPWLLPLFYHWEESMMRKLLVSLLLALTVTTFAAAPQTAVLDVQNMTCSMCSITIQKALEKVPGVLDAKVDYDHKTAVVKYDPAKADSSALIKATTNAGFPSKLHSRTPKWSPLGSSFNRF